METNQNSPADTKDNQSGIKTIKSPLQKKKSAVLTRYPSHLFRFHRDTDQLTHGPNEWIHACLPYDILLVIFVMLPRKDLRSASIVCKLWRSVSKDPLFGWITLKIVKFQEGYTRGLPLDQLTLQISSQKSICTLKDSKNALVSYINFVYEQGVPWRKQLNSREERSEKLEFLMDFTKNNPRILRSYLKHNIPTHEFHYVVELHINNFEQKVRKGEDISDIIDVVLERVQDEQLEYIKTKIPPYIGNKNVNLPQKSNIPTRQPVGMKKGINLYKYQLDVVRWMKSVEDDIAAKIPFKFAPLVPWRSARTDILFDLNKSVCVPAEKIHDYIQSFFPKGGVLADEMGLGKTMEVLGLILANPASLEEESSEEPTADTDDILIQLRFISKATLVVCPNHLIQQWHDEMVKNTDPPLNVLTFDSVPQLRAAGYDAISQADVVIVSLQLLKYSGYYKIGMTKKKGTEGTKKSKISAKERSSRVTAQLKKVRKILKSGEQVTDAPMLEHFKFHRFVVDEAHEVMGDDEMQVQNITGMFQAHPYQMSMLLCYGNLIRRACLNGIFEFLEFPWIKDTTDHLQFVFAEMLWNNLYWRNTKESVKDEYQVPSVVEDLVLLEFTDIEKALYKDLPETGKRELCSKMPSIGSCKTLTDIRDFKIDEKSRLTKQIKTTIFGLKQDIEEHKKAMAKLDQDIAAYVPDPNSYYQRNLENMKYAKTQHQHKIDKELPNRISQEEKTLAVEEELLSLYMHSKAFEERIARANRIARGLSVALTASSNSVGNDNNNNAASMEVEPEEDEEEVFPTHEEITKMKAIELKEFINKYGITPKSSKREMVQQMNYLIKFSKSEEGKKARREQKAAEKKRKTSVKESSSNQKTKKQKTDQSDESVIMNIDTSTMDTKAQNALELAKLVENLGTKMANLISYLKNLWGKAPESRVIIFSQFDSVLDGVGKVLEPQNIKFVFVKGKAAQKIEALNSFKDTDSSVRVILLSLAKAASGSNLIQASHVVLLDPITGTKEEVQAVEAQAIGRAYRQGQTEQVTVVRFLIRETIEYSLYINFLQQQDNKQNPLGLLEKKLSQEILASATRPNLLRSSSVTTILANAPTSVQNAEAVVELLEKVEGVPNNLLEEQQIQPTESQDLQPQAEVQIEQAQNEQQRQNAKQHT